VHELGSRFSESDLPELPWSEWEAIIRRDPGGRGVASYLYNGLHLGYGELERAAIELSRNARRVAIVTGFCIADANPPAAETDGPPGALFLGRALAALGVEVVFVSDAYGVPLLAAGIEEWNLPSPNFEIVEMPFGEPAFMTWIDLFFDAHVARGLTHLVSIERAGPSHTNESISERESPVVAEQFEREVPPEHRDKHHNMRGKVIDECTPPAGRIFDRIAVRRLSITTIGIGDGGNEIGMGKFPWSVLREAIRTGPAAFTACRIATDYSIVAGISNWGGYALGLAVATIARRSDLISTWTRATQQALIERIVAAGAVDGVSKQRTYSVDGVSLDEYLAIFESLREVALRSCGEV
jgi:D-glutamate cyclase